MFKYAIYDKLRQHSECTIDLEEDLTISAIEITDYGYGENLAVECMKCNEVIVDFDRPLYGGE